MRDGERVERILNEYERRHNHGRKREVYYTAHIARAFGVTSDTARCWLSTPKLKDAVVRAPYSRGRLMIQRKALISRMGRGND